MMKKKNGKKSDVIKSQADGSRRVTQLLCFVIAASAAIIGFVQARRAVYQYGSWQSPFALSDGETDNGDNIWDVGGNPEAEWADQIIRRTPTDEYTENPSTTTTQLPSVTGPSGNEVVISSARVKIRSGPGGGFESIASASEGDRLRYLGSAKGTDGRIWHRVENAKGKKGWIPASRCRYGGATVRETYTTTSSRLTIATTASPDGRTVQIIASPVNVRSGPGRNYGITGAVSKGERFPLMETRKDSQGNEWHKICLPDNKTGWVLGACCRVYERDGTVSTGASSTTTRPAGTTAGRTSAATTAATTAATSAAVASTTAKSTTGTTTTAAPKTTTSKTTASKTTTSKTTASKTTTSKPSADDSELMKLQPSDRTAKYFIVVYKGSQSVVVYGKDSGDNYTKQVKVFTCSTGKSSSPTRIGSYHIRAKYRWRWLVGNVYGQYNSSISKDYLFHSVPYLRQDASTLENEEYDKLGTPASKGCIRMCVRDCKWIYDNCEIGTQVRIVDAGGPKGPGVPARNSDERYNGWDPSDKWAQGNPYFS